uniref:G-protein coupled receptors family 1 profile domain-containing protein n=1 Tax=Panagrolaimus davidi TaxID=227884 RepID=A0A914PF54_9BILA
MSLQRYLVVCTRWRYTASATLTTFIPITIGIIACVIVPVAWEIMYTEVVPYPINITEPPVVCLNVMPTEISPYFINYTFMCGFAVPLCVMAICYFMLVRHVRQRFHERKGKIERNNL